MGEHKPDMAWWRRARYGMFIHWGLYAIPAGEWDGNVSGSSEWIMNRARIPVAEYEKLAAQFNPVEFNAAGIANLARDAGMKYLVITAKHHDGFALFRSKASGYNVVDATPFKRDIIGELAEACSDAGIRFGVYYSQAQDWHHPDAAGNTWDWPDEGEKNFQRFLDDLVYPQVNELLSNYGPMSVLWFDTPCKITADQSKDLLAFVRTKQPDCIVNSRLGPGGSGWGDFVSLRDNEVPTLPLTEDGETCATLNGNWGYCKTDGCWKSPAEIVRTLADVAAKNANYLLNIGPDHLGRIPQRSADILREAGEWLSVNGESIYNTRPTPFPVNFDWGAATRGSGKIYFHLFQNPSCRFTLYGLRNSVRKAYFLDAPAEPCCVAQGPVSRGNELLETVVETPEYVSEKHRVLTLEIDGEASVHPGIVQQPDAGVTLESLDAMDAATGEPVGSNLMIRGAVARSLEEGMTLSWEFELLKPGMYTVTADCATGRYTDHGGKKVVDTGHELSISCNGVTIDAVIREDERKPIRGNLHWLCIGSRVGTLELDSVGSYTLELRVTRVVHGSGGGFILRNLTLTPLQTY